MFEKTKNKRKRGRVWSIFLKNPLPLRYVLHLLLFKEPEILSVTRWLDFFNIWLFATQWRLALKCLKFAKVGSAFCQIRNRLSKIAQRPGNFSQSGQIWSHWRYLNIQRVNIRQLKQLRWQTQEALLGS